MSALSSPAWGSLRNDIAEPLKPSPTESLHAWEPPKSGEWSLYTCMCHKRSVLTALKQEMFCPRRGEGGGT